MYRPTRVPSAAHYQQRVLAAIACWLLAGGMLLLTRLVPIHTALLGWSAPFWLVLAPLMLLLALDPALPRHLLGRGVPRRHAVRTTAWN